MKKKLIPVLAVVLLVFSACSISAINKKSEKEKHHSEDSIENETTTTSSDRGTSQTYVFPDIDMEPPVMASGSFTIADIWESGFFYLPVEESGMFLTYCDNSDVTLEIYVLDEEFQDALRYIPQAYEPAAIDDAMIHVTEGQWIYIHCSDNSFTTSEPSDSEISWSIYRDYA